MKEHIYERLESNNHVRILILHPSQDPFAPLQCSIKQHELGTTAEQYECISYTWGGETRAHILHCDDGSVVEITANLHSALSRFRSNAHGRYLWTDAVCINQADFEEKSRQIPLMPRIYHYASRVLVWLGSGKDGESKTMLSLGRIRKLPDNFSFASMQGQETAQRLETQSLEGHESIRKFFQLPWFSRRWVVQEAVLNPDVTFYCGLSEISWPRLHFAIESLPDCIWNETSGDEIRKSLQKLGDLWRTRSYLGQRVMNCELFDLLDSFHHFGCKEDKDKVYALAGLASDVQTSTELMPPTAYQGKIHLIPDYSLSDDEVFCQVALQRMQSGRAFTTLAYAGALRPRNEPRALSSWAPDFRLSKLWHTMLEEPDFGFQPTIKLQNDGNLTLLGKVPTPYKQDFHSFGNQWNSFVVHNIFPGPTDSEPRSILQFVRDCLYWMHSVPTMVNLEKDVQKTALYDVLATVAATLGKEKYETDNLTVRWHTKSLFDDGHSENENLEETMPYLSEIYSGLTGRCLFISNTLTMSRRWGDEDYGGWYHLGISLLGISPGDIVDGDVIVRFDGVEQALFFRPEDRSYQVLGDGHFTVLPRGLEGEFSNTQATIGLV